MKRRSALLIRPRDTGSEDAVAVKVGKRLNALIADHTLLAGWQWRIGWSRLPGAISVQVAGTNPRLEQGAFFAASSITCDDEHEVAACAGRLAHKILRYLQSVKDDGE
jgi:hypothetical protein